MTCSGATYRSNPYSTTGTGGQRALLLLLVDMRTVDDMVVSPSCQNTKAAVSLIWVSM